MNTTTNTFKRIAINTGGGDAPGLNAVIHAVVQPTSPDRSLGLIIGAAAVRALVENHDGVMVAVKSPRIDYVPLRVATAKLKLVAADDYGIMSACTLDVSFGD